MSVITEVGEYRAHVTGGPGYWRAVIKRDGRPVWTSTETFKNRDNTTSYSRSARDVASCICSALNDPMRFDERMKWQRANGHMFIGRASSAEVAFMEWAKAKAQEIRGN